MNLSQYRQKIKQFREDLINQDRLQERVERLFPGTKVTLTINNETNKVSISGLTQEQMEKLFQDGIG